MCGLAGIYSSTKTDAHALTRRAQTMVEQLRHRGPDDAGAWVNEEGSLAFGFRRLAIIDLSEAGHQPMVSEGDRFTIAFNGEIYNHAELRGELEAAGRRFRGHSDTEVLLALFERWGVDDAVSRCVGMFAIALWDREREELHLIRDRLGIKPLFVAVRAGSVLFASELKALLADPSMDRTLDPDSLVSFFRYLYVPGPGSIFKGVTKLPPGHILTIRRPGEPLPESRPFWSLSEVARKGMASQFRGSDEEALEEAEELIADAVHQRMYADVPLGALLSGGIDSSLTAALMQRAAGSTQVKTYSVAFEEEEYNEAAHAAAVASYLGTDHTEVTLTPEEAWAVVPRLPEMLDEPFANPAAIPNFLVSQVARRNVTVALSGSGGDELFAGYNRYLSGERLLRLAVRLPGFARRLAASAVKRVPYGRWKNWRRAPGMLTLGAAVRLPGHRAYKLARIMERDSYPAMYRSLVSAWDHPSEVVPSGTERQDPLGLAMRELGASGDLLHAMLLGDQLTYLVDDQLAMVDRMSMAVSLELRVPLLDHRLVEFSWRLPTHFKRRDGEGKWLLRQLLARHVPSRLFDRPKMGLSVPVDAWLRGPLQEWAQDTLADLEADPDGLVNGAVVRKAWGRFLSGEGQLEFPIWAALMYSAWKQRWIA